MLMEIITITFFLAIIDFILICMVRKQAQEAVDIAFIELINAHNDCINRLRDDGK